MIDNSQLNALSGSIQKAIKFHEDQKNDGAITPAHIADLLYSVQNLQELMKQVLELHAGEKLNAHLDVFVNTPEALKTGDALRGTVANRS